MENIREELEKMSLQEKQVVFVLGALAELIKTRMLIGPEPLSEKGLAAFEELVSQEFTVAKDEVNEIMNGLFGSDGPYSFGASNEE